MNIKVIYEETGEDRQLSPVWMMIENPYFDWDKILYVDIHAPFERLVFDEFESEQAAMSVPDFAYIRHSDKDNYLGISLPLVRQSALNDFKNISTSPDLTSIQRIVLRICDIEESLQYNVRKFLTY